MRRFSCVGGGLDRSASVDSRHTARTKPAGGGTEVFAAAATGAEGTDQRVSTTRMRHRPSVLRTISISVRSTATGSGAGCAETVRVRRRQWLHHHHAARAASGAAAKRSVTKPARGSGRGDGSTNSPLSGLLGVFFNRYQMVATADRAPDRAPPSPRQRLRLLVGRGRIARPDHRSSAHQTGLG